MRCEPKWCKPDTIHTLIDPLGGECWVNWSGKVWLNLDRERCRDMTPEEAWKRGYRYGFEHGRAI